MNGHGIDWPKLLVGAKLIGVLSSDVSSVCYDSRAVTPGSVFVAVPGAMPPLSRDGHISVPQALDKGASVVIVQADHGEKWEALVTRGGAESSSSRIRRRR